MATYSELRAIFGDTGVRETVEVGVTVVAAEILSSADTVAPYSQDAGAHATRLKWARNALDRTADEAVYLHKFLVASFNTLTQAQILSATDEAVTSAIRDNIDDIAMARFG